MEGELRKVVEHIFGNWTALTLAVEHSDVRDDSQKVVNEFVDYVVQYCLYTPNLDIDGLQDALDDIMDQEFETVCEDDSTKEIAVLLFNFTGLIKSGDSLKFQEAYNKLPISSSLLCKNIDVNPKNTIDMKQCENKVESVEDVQMEDSEWIEVKSKRRH